MILFFKVFVIHKKALPILWVSKANVVSILTIDFFYFLSTTKLYLIALAIPPGDIADGVAAADQDACFML